MSEPCVWLGTGDTICNAAEVDGRAAALPFLCNKSSDELAATFKNGVASSTCDYRIPEDGTIVSVFGHEHTLGKSFSMILDPGTAKATRCSTSRRGTSTGR